MNLSCRWLLPALLFGAVAGASAQPAAPSRPDPLDAASAVPRVEYRSSLADYRRHAEQPVGSWRAANETVTRIGGWRTYAREAEDAAPAAAPPAAPAAPHGKQHHGASGHGTHSRGHTAPRAP